uniref:hypothetical protein n=1 Tax=Euzebya pacifica TaxID=1608957 RepID=UPI0030FBF9E5
MPTTHRVLWMALAVLCLLLTACSSSPPSDDDTAATRTIEVMMRDIAFEPTNITGANQPNRRVT